MNRWRYQYTASVLRAGGVIAYPTEAVWGLGCDPLNEGAVLRLLAMKRRPEHKGLILVAANIEQVEPYIGELAPEQRQRLEQTWPGFQTWIVPVPDAVPNWIRGRHSSVALRVSAHPVIQAICKSFAGPIVSTSANHAGKSPAVTQTQLALSFRSEIDFVVPGKLGTERKPSPISDISTGQAVR